MTDASQLSPYTARYPSLAGRTVFISGGASGIGEGLVRAFHAQGAKVGFCDLDSAAGNALAAQLQGEHPALFLPCDVTDTAALAATVDAVRQRFGPVSVLLNNAANDRRHEMADVTDEDFDRLVAVNFKHQFFAAQAVADDMRALGGGSIINFGSICWRIGTPDLPIYATAKAAIHGLSRSLARDLGVHGIRVNTLSPGCVMTERQLRLWVTPEKQEVILANQYLKRLIQPDHVAQFALFLAADDSAMCTAQEIIVDAGWA